MRTFTSATQLSQMQLIGDSSMSVAVPFDAPSELKRRVLGAVKSFVGVSSSVDVTIRKFGAHWAFRQPSFEDAALLSLLRTVERNVELLSAGLHELSTLSAYPALQREIPRAAELRQTTLSVLMLIAQNHARDAAVLTQAIAGSVESWRTHKPHTQQALADVRETLDCIRLATPASQTVPALRNLSWNGDAQESVLKFGADAHAVLKSLLVVVNGYRLMVTALIVECDDASLMEHSGGKLEIEWRSSIQAMEVLRTVHPVWMSAPTCLLEEHC